MMFCWIVPEESLLDFCNDVSAYHLSSDLNFCTFLALLLIGVMSLVLIKNAQNGP